MGKPSMILALTTLLCSCQFWFSPTTGHHLPDHRGDHHIPFENVPTFQRFAVEASLKEDVLREQQRLALYGDYSLPLRDAVEAVPEHEANYLSPLRDLEEPEDRVPLRDAVEHRPPARYSGFDHDALWLEQLTPPAIRREQEPANVVCHLEAKAVYREEPFALQPRAVPAYKCSHLVYVAAGIDPFEFTVTPHDYEYDIIRGGYKAATGLHHRDPSLRVLISISSSDHGRLYREIMTRPSDRVPIFVDSVLDFLQEHDFDGIELDWENGSTNDLKVIARSLRAAFEPRGYTLAIAVRPEQIVDAELSSLVDMLLLRAWHQRRVPEVAQTPAPMSLVTSLVDGLKKRGVPAGKIVLGVPFFGWSYQLSENDEQIGNTLHALGLGIDGQYTKQKGELAYFEICEKIEEPWQYKRHEQNGSYLVSGNQWIGYDDPLAMKIKAAYVKSAGLGGIALHSLDLDDFQGICGDSWPLLTAATTALGILDDPVEQCPKNGLYSDPDNCSGFLTCFNGQLHRGSCGRGRFYDSSRGRCVPASPEICNPGQSNKFGYPQSSTALEHLRKRQQLEKLELNEDSLRVVCYLTSWSMYRKGLGKFVPEHLDSRLCTDVVYAFAGLNPETLTVHSFDPWADIDNNLYQRVTSIVGSRVLLAVGGWTDSAGDKYSRLASTLASRRKFAKSATQFLLKHSFQGLSLEWNYPGCWQSDCRRGPESDRKNFVQLLAELRREFDLQETKLTLAVALSGYKEVIDKGYDVEQISRMVDFMTVMTYDYHGSWESKTSHLAPLFAIPGDASPYYNMNYTLNYLVSLGADPKKLIADVPMYGQSYRLSMASKHGLGEAASGPGAAGEYTRQPGMLAYYEICERIEKENWKTGPGPSAHYKEQFVSFDNPASIMYKGQYLKNNGFGGAAAWTVDLDDFTNRCCQEPFPLLRTINRAIGRLLTPAPSHKDCKKPQDPVTPVAPTMTSHSDANENWSKPTSPMSSTTWPTWSDRPSSSWDQSSSTTWSWSEKPSTWWDHSSSTTWPWNTQSTTTTTTTRRPTVTWATTTTRKPSTMAEYVPNGDSPMLGGVSCTLGEHKRDPHNCGTYYRCVLGEFKRESCAPGLHYDTNRNQCDWPSKVNCQLHAGTPSTTTTRRPTTSSTTVNYDDTSIIESNYDDFHESNEKQCEHGQYYTISGSCSEFQICVNGKLVRQRCGPGLNWSSAKNMCDWAYKNPCKAKAKPPVSITEDVVIRSQCESGSFLPVPDDCESYYTCLWGQLQLNKCAPGLHFNVENKICDWPARARCTVYTPPQDIPLDPLGSDDEVPVLSTESPKPSTESDLIPLGEYDSVSPLSGHFKVVCYFTNWAWYRRGIGKYLPEDIDHSLCTHIVYGFAVLDPVNLVIKAHDSWADYDNHFYERVVAYKKKGVKVSLALGGWNDSEGNKYSRLVNDAAARQRFVTNSVQFIEKYGFDGLDLDWEYPVCWQTDCKKGPASDKEGFTALVRELSDVLRPKGLLLSSAVSPNKKIIDAGYDVPTLSKYFDWIAVMTYDFHGQWDKKTGHASPLYYHDDDDIHYFNANYSINYWLSKGAPARTLVMGLPLYGQAFTLNDLSSGTGLNRPASVGVAGEFTMSAGFLAYYEICDRVKNKGWTVVQDPQRRMGPYAYKGNQWVGYDDADMIRQKAQYIRDMGLGGGMVWALDLDDFKGRCNEGKHPLMHTLQQVLAMPPNKHDRPIPLPVIGQELEWKPPRPTYLGEKPVPPGKPVKPVKPVVDKPETPPTVPSPVEIANEQEDEYKMVCYFTNWAWYRQGAGKFLPEDIDTDLCTHIMYGFAVLDGSTLTIKTHDSWADIDNRFYERVVAHKKKGKKVLVAIGGWNDSADDKYSKLVNSPDARLRFITNIVQFIDKYGFDGLDLDWEYPVCWQVDCKKGPKSDKDGFSALVRELSAVFKPRGLLLSAAVSPNKRVINEGYDVPVLAEYLDWIAVMTYDYHGQWDKKTGHNAPFYARPDDWEQTFNANFSIHYWMERGAPAKKLVMGVPLYGQSFSLAEAKTHGLEAPTYGGGEAGDDTRARGFLSYYEICQRTLKKGWTVVEDPLRRIGPYAYKGDQWVSFDDAEQVRRKAEYIKELGLGGGMVWALDLDDFKNYCGCEPNPLLRTMNRVLRNYPPGPLCKVTEYPLMEGETATARPIPEVPLKPQKPQKPSKPSKPLKPSTPSVPLIPSTPKPARPTPPKRPISTTRGPSTTSPVYDEVEMDTKEEYPSMKDCEGKLFLSHKTDCRKYYVCNHDMVSEQICPNGLYWNREHCDWPVNTKCDHKPFNDEIASVPSGSTPSPSVSSTPWSTTTQGQWQWVDPSLTSTTPEPIDEPEDLSMDGRKMVCYFTNWAWYRQGAGKYLPEDIDTNLCTHIVYGFAVLDFERLVIKMHDSWADVDNRFYQRVVQHKKKGIRVLIGIGGWNDSAGDKYSRLVNNPQARKRFVDDIVKFIEKHQFSGLDLDWEYPVCWQVDCKKGPASDKESFSAWVRELSAAFKPRNLLLSAAVSPSKRVIDAGYDVPTLGQHLDWIAVMTYDYHGQWDKKTGHNAPLYYYPGDDYDYFNANYSMRYWIEKGAPSRKLVMGLPMYGQSFTLAKESDNGLNAPAPGPGQAGTFTRAAGFLSFYEICTKVKKEGWTKVKDPEGRIGPYATHGNQWVGYDDISQVARKAQFIRDLDLGGGMIWALDLDDFRNTCGCGKYPLLTTLTNGLRGIGTQNPTDCT